MPCFTPTLSELQIAARNRAINRLAKALGSGAVRVVIGRGGSISFAGWTDNEGVSDLCAYRKLVASNSPELRRAINRAEAMSGNKLDQRAIAQGLHSHDGGKTWATH